MGNFNRWIFLAFIVVWTSCKDVRADLNLTPTTNPISHPFGETLSVECSDPDGLTNQVRWYGPNAYRGEGVANTYWITVKSDMPRPGGNGQVKTYVEQTRTNAYTLWIENFVAGDAGEYRCTGTKAGVERVASFNLEGFKAVTIETKTEQHLVLGRESQIRFTTIAEPRPQLAFTHDNVFVSLENGNKYLLKTISTDTGVAYAVEYALTIFDVTHADAGQYEISARQPSFQKSTREKLNIRVYEAPQFTMRPESVTGVATQPAILNCRADGTPPPQYRWFTGTVDSPSTTELTDQVSGGRFRSDRDTGDLFIDDLLTEDEGYFWCQPFNDADRETPAKALLTVNLKPWFSANRNDTVTREGSLTPAEIFCQVDAKPEPSLQFYREDTKEFYVPGTYDDGRVSVTVVDSVPSDMVGDQVRLISQRTLTLRVANPTSNDTGNYTCMASNSAGDNKTTLELKIRHTPILVYPVPTDPSPEVYNWGGNSRNLTCKAKSFPPPNWVWERQGGGVIEQDTTGDLQYRKFTTSYDVWSETHLEIRLPDGWRDTELDGNGVARRVFGTYECSADNEIGIATKGSVVMKQGVVPAKPRVTDIITTATTVVFNISLPQNDGGVPVFRLQYVLTTGGGQASEIANPVSLEDRFNVLVENLDARTTYRLNVQAENQVGLGATESVDVQTKTPTSPGPITITSTPDSHSANSYYVSWIPPSNGGERITRYEYKFAKATETGQVSGSWSTLKRVARDHRAATLSALDADTYYVLSLRANNAVGSGTETTFLFHTQPGGITQVSPISRNKRPTIDIGVLKDVPIEYIIITAALVFLLLLIIIDLICCCSRHCGIFWCLRRACGGHPKREPDILDAEDSGSKDGTGLGHDNLVLTDMSAYQADYDKVPLRSGERMTGAGDASTASLATPVMHKGYIDTNPAPADLKSFPRGPPSHATSTDSLNSRGTARRPYQNPIYHRSNDQLQEKPNQRSNGSSKQNTAQRNGQNGQGRGNYPQGGGNYQKNPDAQSWNSRHQAHPPPSPPASLKSEVSETPSRASFTPVGQRSNNEPNSRYNDGRSQHNTPRMNNTPQAGGGRGYPNSHHSSDLANGVANNRSMPAPPRQFNDSSSMAMDYPELYPSAGRGQSQQQRQHSQPQHQRRGPPQNYQPEEIEMPYVHGGPPAETRSMGGVSQSRPSEL